MDVSSGMEVKKVTPWQKGVIRIRIQCPDKFSITQREWTTGGDDQFEL